MSVPTLIIQCGDHGHATLDPVLLRVPLRHGDADVHDEVRGVARGQQHAAALRGLVHGAVVDVGRAADGASVQFHAADDSRDVLLVPRPVKALARLGAILES